MQDTYKTIAEPTQEVLFKDKSSKFLGYAFPFNSDKELIEIISDLKSKHPKAGHFCYAYQIGKNENSIIFRANDDGEPNNSAGMPIYGQIQSFGVTNTLIVVVRYFGGTKLGISGLINAYKSTAQLALEHSRIIKKTINVEFLISFEYKDMNKVMRIIKEKNLKVLKQKLELSCEINISVRKKDSDAIFELFNRIYKVNIKEIND